MIRAITNFFRIIFGLLELGVLLLILANVWVVALTSGRTYNKISKVPSRDCALVLGTSPKMRSGVANPYFTARMDAVGTLYHHGKVKKIIVSGEKSENYDEPAAMKRFLVYTEGVPENIIIEDPKGFNTHKSILRCKNVYGEKNVIIVSQGFHNLRALFFARNNGMNALGYDAQDVSKNESFYRNHTREFFARVLAVFYYVLGISPEE
ncbi:MULTISPECIES: SanA/YdcF family protein [Epilithonimonas]|jgi:SanA protein|uniref:SanA protein n=2 Tax=Epilithonimonas TaxID=2782229 RepID=A0A3N0XBJ1_9FLAO|nr:MULTISPECIES: ElyC/SanA/YdcF family protein [Epilithonimonas]REC71595.1 SanA protein [Epilithonimonas hispanica]ROI14767.1 SanA protein [Epilithonimonas hominis]HAP94767.1 SanA protein [Chryseobacterium sp.]